MQQLIKFFSVLLGCVASAVCFANDFKLTTIDFLDTGAMPVLYSCDGKDVSPLLTWSNAPEKTQSFALIVSDPDAPSGTWYHWVVFNIPAKTTEFAEGIAKMPGGTIVGQNSFGHAKYNGPCPPKGKTHTYLFTLYALDTKLSLGADAKGEDVVQAMKGHLVGEAKLTGVYNRWL